MIVSIDLSSSSLFILHIVSFATKLINPVSLILDIKFLLLKYPFVNIFCFFAKTLCFPICFSCFQNCFLEHLTDAALKSLPDNSDTCVILVLVFANFLT